MIKLVCLFWLLLSFTLSAQIIRLSPNEGLSQSSVNTMLIDGEGYLWISTEGGLNRYDGYQILKVEGPNGELLEANIDRIYQDPDGHIWITSSIAGIFRFDPKSDTYRQFDAAPVTEEEFTTKPVFALQMLDSTHILLGRSKDVAILDTDTGQLETLVALPDWKNTTFVRDVLVHQNNLYIATSDGAWIYNLDSKQIRPLNHLDEISHPYQNNTKFLYLKDEKTLLLGAVQGLYEIDISEANRLFDAPFESFQYKTIIEDLNIWRILPKPNGLVIATDKGIMHFDWQSKEIRPDQRLPQSQFNLVDPSIIYLIQDRNGGYWAATRTDGAFYLPPEQGNFKNINNLTLTDGEFSHQNVWDIEVLGGYWWIATHDGITRYDPTTNAAISLFKGYLGEAVFPEFVVYKLMQYNGKLWVWGMRGLFILDPLTLELTKPVTQSSEFDEIIQDRIAGVTLLDNGKMYFIHSEKGMFEYDIASQYVNDITATFNGVDPFLSHGFSLPLASHPNDPLFYFGGVLSRYEATSQSLHPIYSVPNANDHLGIGVNSYVIDKNNILWISLSNFGLIGLTADTYEHVYTIDLEKNNLGTLMYNMYADGKGMIWMSSHKGIWRLDPDNLHFQQFSTQDGLVANEFNGGASTRLDDGQIIYGSVQGITAFYPEINTPNSPLITQVNITSVNLMSRDIRQQGIKTFKRIVLNHDDLGLEVAFSAMVFSYQDRIVYEYQISGGQKTFSRSKQWVLFPKLNPGSYELKVWAKDPLTGNYTPPAKLEIEVLYPLWRSPLAIAIYILTSLSLLVLWVVRRNRIQQMLLKAHRETQDSEARLKLALEGSNSGVWDWRSQNSLIYQPRLKSELGYSHENVTLDEYLAKIHPQDKAIFRLEWLEFVQTQKGYFNCTYRLRHQNGHWRWYKDFGKVMEWQEHSPLAVAGTYTNMTRERVFEERARIFGAAFEQTRDWVFILDKRLRIRACNTALQQAFGMAEIPLSSSSLTLGLNRRVRMQYLRTISRLIPGEHFSVEETVTLGNGERRQVLVKVSAVAGDNTDMVSYVVVMTDITEQKRAEKELHQLANYDAITGLPNRTLIIDRIHHAVEIVAKKEQPVAVLTINVKRLQNVAELYGVDVFSELLRSLAREFQSSLKEYDSLAIGSQKEFYVVMEHVSGMERVTNYCRDLIERFEHSFCLEGHSLQLSISIGVAVYPDDALDAVKLLQLSNLALHHAMQRNDSSYQFFKQEMNYRMQRASAIEKALYLALEQGAFTNHYQPIVDAKSHRVVGLEVLIRWPEEVEFGAEELARIAEQNGLITKLTLQTLERALIDLATWQTAHPNLYVSVNLSAHDFKVPNIATQINAILQAQNVVGRYVAFEITESVLLADIPNAINQMHALKQLGCRLYMDDFGTGYSSLTYLQTLPVDALKIDKSFIEELETSASHHAIVKSILGLATNLGKVCIAEGVETQAQADLLTELGCSYLQGYWFSQPVSREDVLAQLK
ncbi:putative Sensory box protein [Pseudoalteromonas luteoviolacea B = ATCC 29581]|nr:putative Sensory box protein [Pseudoalteromonas luteoviolacea B = ATCC 29581]